MSILTVFWMVLKQILKNWKLELILLLGLTLAVAVSSCIPIYTEGVLQMVMTNRWKKSSSISYPPGSIILTDEQWYDYHPLLSENQWRDQNEAFQQYLALDNLLQQSVPEIFDTELLNFSKTAHTNKEAVRPIDQGEEQRRRYLDICFLTDLEKQVELVSGRWYSTQRTQSGVDIVEVLIDENAAYDLNLKLNNTYLYPLLSEKYEEDKFLELKVVGIFKVNREMYNSPIWVEKPPFSSSFFVAEDVFNELIIRDDTRPYKYSWYWNMDYRSVRFHQLPQMIGRFNRVAAKVGNISNTSKFTQSSLAGLKPLLEQGKLLERLLFILGLPILGMIFYYTILAASLTIQKRGNEIALLRSRGAGLLQLLLTYLIEWGTIAFAAFIIGPYIGLFIARLMGASSGFLEFVNRDYISVIIPPNTYFYALLTITAAVLSCLLLVLPAAGESIVSYKQKVARENRKPVWQRYYIDFIFLIFSIYGYRELTKAIASIQSGTTAGTQLMLDPLLFIIPVLFIATAGLLSLRIIPLIIRFVSVLTDTLPEVTLSVSLRQFFRNSTQYLPLIFFIIMTVSLGIYSSSIARTLNQNFIDSMMYKNGAEIVISEKWSFDTPSYGTAGQMVDRTSTIYEPPFYIHKELPGVRAAARVMTKKGSVSIGSSMMKNGTMMAIDPDDFARVTWFRDDLTEEHLYSYLNLLISHEQAALINGDFFEEAQLEIGDWITFGVGRRSIEFFVAGIIDYWPTIYPESFPVLIGNLDYFQAQYIIEPYDVWLSLEEDASIQLIINELRENDIWVTRVVDTPKQIIEGKRDPQRMGIFGILSIGFVVAVLITVMGFFLYNFLSLKKRLLEFGVMRAIGLSITQLISILTLEQVLTVGIGFVLGTIYGITASRVFMPFLQMSQNLEGIVPGFRIVIQKGDIRNILIILGGTLVIGLVFLSVFLVRLKLHEAIKLGEEA